MASDAEPSALAADRDGVEASSFDADAERTVLGLLLRSTPDTDAQVAGVRVGDFHLPHHEVIAAAARAVHVTGGPRGIWPVIERLVDDGRLEAAGGVPTIETAALHHGEDPVRALELVIGLAKLRRLLVATREIADAVEGAPLSRITRIPQV